MFNLDIGSQEEKLMVQSLKVKWYVSVLLTYQQGQKSMIFSGGDVLPHDLFYTISIPSYSLIFLALLKESRLKVNFQDTPVNLIKCFPLISQIEKERRGVIYE